MENKYGRRLGKSAKALQDFDTALLAAKPGTTAVLRGYNRTIDATRMVDGVSVIVSENGKKRSLQAPTVEEAIRRMARIQDAILTIIEKGRSYTIKRKTRPDRVTLHVWSKDVTILENLTQVFGGNHYRHQSGFEWMCSKRSVLYKIRTSIHDEGHELGENIRLLWEVRTP